MENKNGDEFVTMTGSGLDKRKKVLKLIEFQ